MTVPPAPDPPPLLSRLAAAFAARRAQVEAVLAREGGLSDPDVLHDLRVALRRTAALARLTRGLPRPESGESLRTASRDLRRALSPTRTQDVSRARLLTRFRRDRARRAAAATLAGRLSPENGEGPQPRLSASRLAALRRAFSLRDAELAALDRTTFGKAREAEETRLRRTVRRRLRRKRKRVLAFGEPKSETLHRMRIAAKDFRYSLEFVRDVVPSARPLLPPLREFQDVAGDAHDRAELVLVVRRLLGELSRTGRRAALPLLPVLERDASLSLRRAQTSARGLIALLSSSRLDWRRPGG